MHDLDEPVWVRHARHSIGHKLHGCRNSDNLLDGSRQTVAVVLPVKDAAHVH